MPCKAMAHSTKLEWAWLILENPIAHPVIINQIDTVSITFFGAGKIIALVKMM